MTILSKEQIKVGATAVDKTDAIKQAGTLLVNSGRVTPEYVDGMLEREDTMSTYLGNGVAIPHGMHESIQYVQSTAISVLQVPNGVAWEDDEMAYLVIGIAAKGEEHMGILANLADIIEDEDVALTLGQTASADEIMRLLNQVPQIEE